MKKFLIIEDDLRTAQTLQKGLLEHHFTTDVANDGEVGLQMLADNEYELIILDAMLPKHDGWDILSHLRKANNRTPVLMLTALSDVNSRVKGLQAGADDYLAKPFAFSELLARIEAILRRTRAIQPQETFNIGDLTVSMTHQSVKRGSKTIELSPKEFHVLCLLAENTGRFVSRKELAERVWDIHFDCETNVVDVAIGRLRQKVDGDFETKLIHTVRGVGYVLETR
jgi:two-component system copper resistance phosphate regulon response regulator CusR